MVRDTLHGLKKTKNKKKTHITQTQKTWECGCVCVQHIHTYRHPMTNSNTTKVTSPSTASPGVPLFQSHLLWTDFNTTELCVWEFAIVKACRLPLLLIFLLYSHPLQLSERGCMPPPTPIALLSITPRWQRADTSSHSHSALNITLLQSTTTATSSHISTVQFSEYLCHKLYFILFLGIRQLWCNTLHLSIQHFTVYAFHYCHVLQYLCERCLQTEMLAFCLFNIWL